jgi:pimeloyl-ACP methyl ester carboxylesterase
VREAPAVIQAADGTELAVSVRGAGPPVLLCNGAGEPATQWDDVLVAPLLAVGCSVVAWDYRGVAPSADPARPATMADVVGDAVSVVEDVGLGPAVVVGYSSGGWVATELARLRPDLVRAAVAIGGIGPAPAVEREWLDGVLAAGGAAEPGGPAVATLRHWSAWAEWVDADPERLLADLEQLSCPVQVIAFGRDPYLTPEMAEVAHARLLRGELVVFGELGHTGLWDDPATVAPVVTGFVGRFAHGWTTAPFSRGTAPPGSPPP